MRFLKQNTATRVTVGPFMDKTDGVTPETALTVTNCKLTLMVDDGGVPTLVLDAAATASGGNNDMVHVTNDDAGFYDLELTAAQTNYVGRAMLSITDAANHCPVFHEFMIVPANVYDSLFGTDLLDVNTAQWLGTACATPTTNGVPEVDCTYWAGGLIPAQSVTGVPEVDITHVGGVAASGVATVDANVVTVANGAITAAAIATGAIDADALAADAGTEIGAAVKTSIEAAGSHLTLIKTKTDYLPSATAGAAGGVFIAGTNAATSVTTAFTTTFMGNLTGSVGSVATGGITSGSFASGAITSTVMADNSIDSKVIAADAINAASLKADALTAIGAAAATATWELDITAVGGLGSAAANLKDANSFADTAATTLGTAGAGLTNVPWNASWDAEVQSECDDAITANTLVKRIAVTGIGDVTDAGTGTEVFVYGGVTATVTVDNSGNRSLVWS